jgi:hypothetical protein
MTKALRMLTKLQCMGQLIVCASALIGISMGPASSAVGDALAQRMRLPVGSYWIGGGGGREVGGSGPVAGGGSNGGGVRLTRGPGGAGSSGYSLPAYCIDRGRSAPLSSTPVSYFSGDVQVHQYRGQELIGTKSLNEATAGPDPWLTVSGLTVPASPLFGDKPEGSAVELAVTPTNPDFSYRIDVQGLAIAGQNKDDVEQAVAAWTGNSELMSISTAFDQLRKTLLRGTDASMTFASRLEWYRQRLFEWEQFGNSDSGAKIPSVGADTERARAVINRIVGKSFATKSNDVTASDRLDWVTLARGKPLEHDEMQSLSVAMNAIGAQVGVDQNIYSDKEKSVLATYSRILPYSVDVLAEFRSLRSTGGLTLTNALRQSAYGILNEPAWTTGSSELERLVELHCIGGLFNIDSALADPSEQRA